MRYIHRVALKEKFVASGVYTYYEDGRPNGAVERWVIHEQPAGAMFVRVDYDARAVDSASRLVQVLLNPDKLDNQIERFDTYYYWRNVEIKAYYSFFDAYAQVGFVVKGGNRIQEEIALQSKFVVNPMAMSVQNYVIQLAQNAGESFTIYSPGFTEGQSTVIEKIECSAKYSTHEELEISGTRYSSRRFSLNCDDLLPQTFWFDENDMLLRYENQQHLVLLSCYSRRLSVKQ